MDGPTNLQVDAFVARWHARRLRLFGLLLALIATPVLASQECVVLLHGLARTAKSMSRLGDALQARGLTVANAGYPSRRLPIGDLAPLAVERGLAECRKLPVERIHFVTHSLGGILLRYYLSGSTIPELGRVVMLGPPNQGSEVADDWSRVPGFALVNGPAGEQLGTGEGSVPVQLGPVTYPVGVIAGTRSVNPLLSLSFSEPNDGKVSVSRARVAGMTDFIEIKSSHPFLMRNPEAIRQTIEFLAHGRFSHDVP